MPPTSTSIRLKRRRTKFIATVGPASRDPAMLEAMIRAGVNVFRLNLARGEQAEHRLTYERIRGVAYAVGEPIAVIADLGGPNLRVGHFEIGSLVLKEGERVVATTRPVAGGPGLIPVQYAGLAVDVRPGDHILLNDGLVDLRVDAVDGTEIACTVLAGGVLMDRASMNLPNVMVSAPALTDKDRDDARFAMRLRVDFLALSFVRRPSDVAELKELVAAEGQTTPIIAKIEKPQALDGLDEILDAADGIMVARGDLGVELAPEAVPIVQQELVRRARERNKPVIVATQMLESMVEHLRPTRAEVSDVAGAVFSGADALMLSAETAVGAHPLQAVEMMDRVARHSEGWQWVEGQFRSITEHQKEETPPLPMRRAVARSVAQLSRDLQVRSVVVRTLEGTTAAVVSATRPAAPVVAITMDARVSRRLSLLWGVVPRLVTPVEFDRPQETARRLVVEMGLAAPGQVILMLAGFGQQEPTITALPI
jgi:pyruvate kinase